MSAKYTATQVREMAALLEGDFDSAEAAAAAALALAESMWQARSKYTVVGQLARTMAGTLDPSEPEAVKVALGWYSTEGDARAAAESLTISTATKEEWRAWVLNVAHCSPAELMVERKRELQALEAKQDEARRRRVREQIDKYAQQREAAVVAAKAEAA